MKHVLVTGATGFIGNALCAALVSKGVRVGGALRHSNRSVDLPDGVGPVVVGELGPDTDWSDALEGIDTVVHLAARVHILNDSAVDPLRDFRWVNTEATKKLAEDACASGVKRIVFVSTIKVHGEGVAEGEMPVDYCEDGHCVPESPYALSKWEAEKILQDVAYKGDMEFVVLRPPLVYGPGVKGNFLRLLDLIKIGVPLPLKSLKNKRSLIYIQNLIDALIVSAQHPKAANQTFLVSDGHDVSTPELIQHCAAIMEKPNRLMPFPGILLRLGCRLIGRFQDASPLIGSLTVDNQKIQQVLSFKFQYSLEDGLTDTLRWYLGKEKAPQV